MVKTFEISRRARRYVERIHAWWSENRPAACPLFLDELANAELLLRANPEPGLVYQSRASGLIRRLLLSLRGE